MNPKAARRDRTHEDRKKEGKKLGWAEREEFDSISEKIEAAEYEAFCDEVEDVEFKGHLDDPCWCKDHYTKLQVGCYRYEACYKTRYGLRAWKLNYEMRKTKSEQGRSVCGKCYKVLNGPVCPCRSKK